MHMRGRGHGQPCVDKRVRVSPWHQIFFILRMCSHPAGQGALSK